MLTEELQKVLNGYESYISSNGLNEDVINAYVLACGVAFKEDVKEALKISHRAKTHIENLTKQLTGGTMWDLEKYCFENKVTYSLLEKWYEVLKHEAQNKIIDSYFRYLEKKREPKDRFYEPKRKQFMKIGLVKSLQDMLDDKLDILSISMPPGSSKTTCAKFFNSGVIGWFPKDFNLFYSHSGDITRMYYDGVYDIVTNTEEYTWNEIFPDLQVTSTNAKMEQFNIGKYKPFPNVQCTSVGSKNAGKVRCNKFLLCDDLIGGIEEALNKNRLDNLWNVYSVDARQRKIPGCKEIHIATRWSVHDVIGRLQQLYDGNDRVKFIAVPDIDPITGESNFDFEFNGFDVEFFHDQELAMDDISYRCLYKNEPVEREGLLYHEDDLRRYSSLPFGEPDAVIGICDTKSKGVDFMVLPCFYQYGNDYYLVDCICDDSSDYGMQYERLSNIIVSHKMQQCEFESNAGGDRLAHEINKIVTSKGGICNITTKATETNKETRIIVNSDWIKRNCLFKQKEDYSPKSDYGLFMNQLLNYSVSGKNKHDDVVDCLANFALFISRGTRTARVEAVINPFRMGAYGYGY